MSKTTVLVILDGFGYRTEKKYNAIAGAHTPTLAYLRDHYPHTLLQASGPAVGLPEGVPGNSEVGHLTIGSGRIIEQSITRIHDLIAQKKLCVHPLIKNNFEALAKTGKTLHLMGLLSDAGAHSHIEHLFALIECAKKYGISRIAIHCFLDGRDTPPQSAQQYLQLLQEKIRSTPNAVIASIAGRMYAMDRNNEWSRTQATYTMITTQQPPTFESWQQAIDYFYKQNITDEFIPPTQLSNTIINNGDGVIFFNFRPDRARQLTRAFIDPTFDAFSRPHIKLAFFITPIVYDATLPTQALLQQESDDNALMDMLCQHGYTTFAIAETEKYAHVTYFFNLGRERVYPNETRVIVPSISAQTYKDSPCMRAPEITDQVLASLHNEAKDFYVINYANPDMVGHSGDFAATVKAIECVDKQLGRLYTAIVEKLGGTLYITGDHGNAELMYDEEHAQPHTSHTTNPVEFFFVNQSVKDTSTLLPLKGLKDIAPFILSNMGLSKKPAKACV